MTPSHASTVPSTKPKACLNLFLVILCDLERDMATRGDLVSCPHGGRGFKTWSHWMWISLGLLCSRHAVQLMLRSDEGRNLRRYGYFDWCRFLKSPATSVLDSVWIFCLAYISQFVDVNFWIFMDSLSEIFSRIPENCKTSFLSIIIFLFKRLRE